MTFRHHKRMIVSVATQDTGYPNSWSRVVTASSLVLNISNEHSLPVPIRAVKQWA